VGGRDVFFDGRGQRRKVVVLPNNYEIGKRIAIFAQGAVTLLGATGAGLLWELRRALELFARCKMIPPSIANSEPSAR